MRYLPLFFALFVLSFSFGWLFLSPKPSIENFRQNWFEGCIKTNPDQIEECREASELVEP